MGDVSLVSPCVVPEPSLLGDHRRAGSYTDCFVTQIAGAISHAEFVEAFYTTRLFKAERLVLSWVVAAPSTDQDAKELARGQRNSFAAWNVEARSQDQVLLATGRTRSWLMVRAAGGSTDLYFGSAVVPKNREARPGRLDFGFSALLGLHKLYSRALLRAARAKLESVR